MIIKIFLFLFLTSILFNDLSFAKDRKIQYTREDISDYFYGIVSASKNETDTAYQHLNKIQFIKNSHSNFNVKFIHTLILLEKYKQAFAKSSTYINSLLGFPLPQILIIFIFLFFIL